MKLSMILIGLTIALGTNVASAAPAKRETVLALLRAHHPKDLTATEWKRLGDDVDLILMQAASEPSLLHAARARAIRGLSRVATPRAERYLRRALASRKTSPDLLAVAAEGYARGFSTSRPAEVLRISKGLLAHDDFLVRTGAVRALKILATPGALEALHEFKTKERHPAVREALEATE